MKNLLIATIAFCAVGFASCQGSKSIKSYSDIDSLSYAIGIDVTNQLGIKAIADSSLNAAVVAAGVRDFFADKTAMTPEEATAFVNEFFQVRLPAKQKAENQAWLDKVKADNPNIQTTASGLMYEVINAGDQAVKATNDADQVMVNYALSLKDGKEVQRNDSISFALNRVIPAWTEGMKLVGKGGEIVLWVPSELGYGAQASGPIPANSALRFDVTLLDVIPAPAAE